MTHLLRLAAIDPATAYALALGDGPGDGLGDADRVTALRAAAVAANELGLLDEGLAHLDEALSCAVTPYAAAQVRMNLVGLLAARGDITGALSTAAEAEGVLHGPDADRLAANIAGALARAGRLTEADVTAAPALSRLRDGGDPVTLLGLLTNLGLARVLNGDGPAAESLLNEAVEVGRSASLRHQTAMAQANLAYVVSRRGDLAHAFRLYAEAEPGLTGERLAQTRLDQAETLIHAGLTSDARPLLSMALRDAEDHGYACDLADGLLLLAHAELSDDDPERAAATAERARALFAAQERTGWMLLAEHLLLRARWTAGERSALLLGSATATAERLERGGWLEASAEARIIAARVALHLRRPASHLLKPLARARTNGPASLRVAAYHAIALDHWARLDRRGALAAIWSGLNVLEEHAEALTAMDLRARAAGHGSELATLGLHLARSARELLTAEERRRTLARRPLSAHSSTPERAALLTELRNVSTRHFALSARGEPSGLTERLASLETELRALTRRHRTDHPQSRTATIPALTTALGDRTLLELIQIGDELHAVTITRGRLLRHHLATFTEVAQHARLTRAAIRRLATDPDDAQAGLGLEHNTSRLQDVLLASLPLDRVDRELIIAPTGALHALPWAALPALAGRPFTVVPSATSWIVAHEQRRRAGRQGHIVLAAGPDLAHARAEVNALRVLYRGARTLTRAEGLRTALNDASLAHIAAHGEFRDGNALLSSLRLADGPLMGYDLEALEAPPQLVVFSACDVGQAEADSALGLVGILLARGTATVIASVSPVRDEETPSFMVAFHRALATGLSPAHALASVPRTPGVLGFQCFGAL
ncbi:CHAT domain-containing protein [Spirillospora sp. NPDC047279]|uniref:CHAT domain-containing protein n=1 Tax=Spirillospora sp. NPDC047279 TaxID=3155478 RepID=UPI0034112430